MAAFPNLFQMFLYGRGSLLHLDGGLNGMRFRRGQAAWRTRGATAAVGFPLSSALGARSNLNQIGINS